MGLSSLSSLIRSETIKSPQSVCGCSHNINQGNEYYRKACERLGCPHNENFAYTPYNTNFKERLKNRLPNYRTQPFRREAR